MVLFFFLNLYLSLFRANCPMKRPLWSIFLFFLILLSLPSFAEEEKKSPPNCISTGWPHESSDLKPDPALVFGTLENGLRYVILPNQEPKNRLAMYLNVQAGSLQETDAQRGIAHYLEHMLFNGTTHYPPGTLVDYFQSIGMAFGPDTNAHTSYEETVYKLLLPNSEKKTLQDGMQLLADYAGGALLLPEEVDKERGVILAEKRQRDSASSRVYKAKIQQSFSETLLAERDIIGLEEVIEQTDSALLRAYYERWYRPENMIVVVVGDGDVDLIQEVIALNFKELKPAVQELPPCPDFGQVKENGIEVLYHSEADLGYTQITLGTVWNEEQQAFTRDQALQELRNYAAQSLFKHRLNSLLNAAHSPLTQASFYTGTLVQRWGYATLEAQSSAEQWQDALALLHYTLRQTLHSGFSAAELERVREEIMTSLRQQVQAADSRRSSNLARELVYSLNNNRVFLSPEQEMAVYGPALTGLTVEEVNASFRKLWSHRQSIQVAGNAEIEGSEQILAVFNTAGVAELAPWQEQKQVSFPYLPQPEHQAEIEQHIPYPAIGVDRYLFSNGLTVNLKVTDFEPNQVLMALSFGSGSLVQPSPGLGQLAQMFLSESGVGGLNQEELQAALASATASVHFRVDEDSFQFKGRGLSSESELLLQLLHTHLYDPAFRAEAFERVQRRMNQAYSQLQNSVEGMMQLEGERFLAGGNLRYGMVPQEMLQQRRAEEIEKWLRPVFQTAALELSVVGDFDTEEILRWAGIYFGEEGRSRTGEQVEGEQISFPAGKSLHRKVETSSDKAMLTVAWQTDDFWDIGRTRRLSVLASLLDDRLRKQIRDALGLAYSPYIFNRSSTVDPGYGLLRGVVVVEPEQASLVSQKIRQAGATLAGEQKIEEQELRRALEPILTSIRDTVRNNRYWLESVLMGSSRHPQRLQWPESIQSDFAAVTGDELLALAARYLQAEKAAEVILLPEDPKKTQD